LALIAMILGPHRIGDYFTETDFYGAYAQGARLIQHGQFVPARYGVIGPGYEVALAGVGFVVRDLFLAAELLSLLSTLAALLLWFDLLRGRTGSRIALIALLILALNPFVFRYGYAASTDAFAFAFDSLALWLLLARRGRAALAVAGLVAGLAFLTRYSALALLPAAWIVIARGGAGGTRSQSAAEGPPADDAAPPPRRMLDALLFTAGFLAPVVPWVLYSLRHGGGFSFQLHHNIAYEVFARSRGMVWDEYQKTLQPQFHNLWDVIRRDPPAVFGRMAFNVFDHLRLDGQRLLGWPVALAALAGSLLLRAEPGPGGRTLDRALAPVLVAGALLFLSLVPAFYSERYSLPLVPVYAALAAVGFGSPRFAFAL
ncbi:MAG TPA: glycosyltransferase family 39 protein, partial [Ktedonobacterales bacterium]|nr:glycosyltransferase family 39 protein [Ktedonobacterales bacterium]